MTPASVIARLMIDHVEIDRTRSRRPRTRVSRHRLRRALTARSTAWVLALVVAGAATAGAFVRISDSAAQVADLQGRLAQIGQPVAQPAPAVGDPAQAALVSKLSSRVAALQDRLEALRASKVKTVVETKVVTKTVPRWVPNGKAVEVEMTGFAGLIGIHDVQLTHAYGYTDLIGIAVNKSGRTISYVELGCSFVDADGRLLANQIVNRQNWAPGQTWGFDCSGQVDATGGILRVDEMS